MSPAPDTARTRMIRDTNPADTSDVLGEVAPHTVADVTRAITRAKRAYPGWRATPPPERGRVLARAAELARSRLDELARLLTREEGKVLGEARGEVLKGINLLEWYSGEGFRLGGKTRPSEMSTTLLWTMRQPLGVVAIITPWNFPWAEPAWNVAPALVAGNAVLLKPASLTPLVAERYVEILAEAGLPDGVLTLVVGSGGEVGDALVTDPEIRAVSFTGSCEIGGSVYARRRPARQSDVRDGREERGRRNAGRGPRARRRGDRPGRIRQHRAAVRRHEPRGGAPGRIPEAARSHRGPRARARGGERPGGRRPHGPARGRPAAGDGADLHRGGHARGRAARDRGRRLQDGACARGFFVEPTVFAGVRPDQRIAQDEIFGPVLSLIDVASLDEALAVTNGPALRPDLVDLRQRREYDHAVCGRGRGGDGARELADGGRRGADPVRRH